MIIVGDRTYGDIACDIARARVSRVRSAQNIVAGRLMQQVHIPVYSTQEEGREGVIEEEGKEPEVQGRTRIY